MDWGDSLRQLGEQDPALAGELRDLRGLGGVMGWMTGRGVPLSAAEIVQQDEFSLDFVLPLQDGRHVVFGIT
jgi:hypothetical protein